MKAIMNLLAKREAFKSCQIEGIYPQNWTFLDFLRHESELERKTARLDKKAKKSHVEFVNSKKGQELQKKLESDVLKHLSTKK